MTRILRVLVPILDDVSALARGWIVFLCEFAFSPPLPENACKVGISGRPFNAL
jgi:hypothetical protein